MSAAAAEITTVRIIVFVPEEMAEKICIFENAKLAAKLTSIRPSIIRLPLAGGTMIARNIPKSATERALTIRSGRTPPEKHPMADPRAHIGIAVSIEPYI